MKRTKLLSGFLGVAMMFTAFAAFADEAADVAKISATLPVPDYSVTTLLMDLIDKNGTVTEHRVIEQFGSKKNGITSTVFEFASPASIKSTRVLQAEKANKEDDKWIYLPSLKTTRRIATAERSKAFVGSDYTYNDMTIRKFEDDEHTMIDANASITVGGKTYSAWKIKSFPVANKAIEYAYRIQYIDKVSYLPLKQEFYNKQDKMIKVAELLDHGEVMGETGKKYQLRKCQTMTNLVTGHTTKVTVAKIKLDAPISDTYFTQNWLNTGKK
jgi:hypothetical protein